MSVGWWWVWCVVRGAWWVVCGVWCGDYFNISESSIIRRKSFKTVSFTYTVGEAHHTRHTYRGDERSSHRDWASDGIG